MGSTIKVYSLLIILNFPGQLLGVLIQCMNHAVVHIFRSMQGHIVKKQQYVYVASYNM